MPIYCYKCNKCQEEFEVEQKVNDPIPDCPNKENEEEHEVVKQISLTSFVLKGSGWARDNYSSSKKSGKA